MLPLKLCYFDAGVEPEAYVNCVRHSPNQAAANACLSTDQGAAVERCNLTIAAQSQQATHTVNCQNNIFTGVTCTSR
jgi:hypothetical protein